MIDSALKPDVQARSGAALQEGGAQTAFRQGAFAGAAALLVYWMVECWFCSVLPWLVEPHYVYKPVHPGLTLLLLLVYPAGGFLLGGLCGLALRGRLATASGSIVLLVLLNVCLLLSFPQSLWLKLSAALSIALMFLIGRFSGRSRAIYIRVAESPWTASLLILGAEYVASDWLVAKSAVVKLAGLAIAIPGLFLLVLTAQAIAKRWTPRTRKALFTAAALGTLAVALTLQQSPIDHITKSAAPVQAASRPNVILISMDTVRADHLSVYGYARNTSPHLRDLASVATLYTRSIAAGDMTLSTHGSLFTGQYPSTHGAHYMPGQPGYPPLPPGSRTLARTLSERGYLTLGVISNDAFLGHTYGLDQGFQYWDQRVGIPFLSSSQPFYLRWSIEELLSHLYTYPTYEKQARNGGEINRDIFPLLERARSDGRPLFLFVNYMDAHTPYVPPAPFDTLFPGREPHFTLMRLDAVKLDVMSSGRPLAAADRAHLVSQYDGGIAYLDTQIDGLVSRLKQLGLYENTLLIVTSDHGETFGEKNLVGHEVAVYQPLVHVPLIVKYPHQASGATADDLVDTVDIMPTILDGLGYPIPASVQGRSLLKPLGAGQRVFSESFSDPIVSQSNPKFRRVERAIFEDRFKYIQSTLGKRERYDLAADPDENRNLYDAGGALDQALAGELNRWQQNLPRRSLAVPATDQKTLDRLRSLGYAR